MKTEGYQELGEQTIGYDRLGYTVVGERTVFILWAGQDNDNFYISIDTNSAADLREMDDGRRDLDNHTRVCV
jgi:hypothetical protein